jgi:large subunit ribosomal protein L30e
MDIGKEIKKMIETGTVKFGLEEARKSIKKTKLFIVANNCPDDKFLKSDMEGVPIYIYQGDGLELGTLCGKPFNISIISIHDAGKSNILKLKAK